jgi:hypothetical protein
VVTHKLAADIAALAERAMGKYRDAGDEYGSIADAMAAAMMFYNAYRAERLLREAAEIMWHSEGKMDDPDSQYRCADCVRVGEIRAQAAALVENGS